MTWSTDMSKAPRGKYRVVPSSKGGATHKVFERQRIIAASICGVVTVSNWLDDQKRWNMFTRESGPIAWMPYEGQKIKNLPAHPDAAVAA